MPVNSPLQEGKPPAKVRHSCPDAGSASGLPDVRFSLDLLIRRDGNRTWRRFLIGLALLPAVLLLLRGYWQAEEERAVAALYYLERYYEITPFMAEFEVARLLGATGTAMAKSGWPQTFGELPPDPMLRHEWVDIPRDCRLQWKKWGLPGRDYCIAVAFAEWQGRSFVVAKKSALD